MPIYKTGKVKDKKSQYRVVVNYTDSSGIYKKRTKTVYGLSEARLLEMELTMDKPTVTHQGLTFQELYNEYMQEKQHEVRQSTYNKCESICLNHILPYLKNEKVQNLNVQKLNLWRNKIANLPQKTTTKNNTLKQLRAILSYATRLEYIPRNYAKDLSPFKDAYSFDTPQTKLNYYTPEEFKAFIKACESHTATLNDYGYTVFFYIAFYTGMRKGEINALRWSDIEGNIIHVRRSYNQKLKNGVKETPPKNKSSVRDLQMPSVLQKELKEHQRRHKQIRGYSENFRVCGGIDVLKDTAIENRNTLCAKEAGVKHIRIHDFRHSHASVLCNKGINIQEVARRLGHSDVSMTWNTYSHLYPIEEERALEILDTL